MKNYIYYVKGMHCASCEIIIEKEFLKFSVVKSVEASKNKNEVFIKYKGERPSTKELNKVFKKNNYSFYDEPVLEKSPQKKGFLNFISATIIVIFLFFIFQRLGIIELVNVTSNSSLIMFFFLGVVAGLSSCMALTGGLILSLSKQWNEIYSKNNSFLERIQPHLMFNLGRVVSYGILGGILGIIGNKLQISLFFSSFLIIGVSVLMIFLSLQMMGVRYFQKFQLNLPKIFTSYVSDEKNFKGRYMPFSLGASTFFLPCGFTITAQGLALISGNFIQGSLIMFFFALGTAPTLLLIGISSVKFLDNSHLSSGFLKVAGILVLFFAFYNVNSQLAVIGIPNLNTITTFKSIDKDLPPIINGEQVIRINAFSFKYEPNYFKVRVGIPVKWEIADRGTSGCTNAIISRGLFKGEIPLTPGEVSVKRFTPEKTGKYTFSCWMGMVSGTIEVVDEK